MWQRKVAEQSEMGIKCVMRTYKRYNEILDVAAQYDNNTIYMVTSKNIRKKKKTRYKMCGGSAIRR